MVERLSRTWQRAERRHQTGETLGGYRLEELLFDDGVCEVYRAIDELDGHAYLIKCFGRRVADYDEAVVVRAMAHESRLARQPEVEMVVKAFQAMSPLDSHVVCAWREGRSLASVVRNEGVFSEKRSVEVVRDIMTELGVFEQTGIGHGSLTLDGIMMDEDNCIFLGSKGFAGMTGVYSCLDARNGQFDVCSDFFSVGVMIYELLTGEKPFGDGGKMTPLWERRPDVSSDIVLFVHRLLSEKRDVRPATVHDALDELEKINLSRHLSQEAICAKLEEMEGASASTRPKVMKRRSDEGRRRPAASGGSWLLKLVGAILVLMSFGIGYGWANSSHGNLRMPKPLAFLEPALKKITGGKDDGVEMQAEPQSVASEKQAEPQSVAAEPTEVADEEDDDEEDTETEEKTSDGKLEEESDKAEEESEMEQEIAAVAEQHAVYNFGTAQQKADVPPPPTLGEEEPAEEEEAKPLADADEKEASQEPSMESAELQKQLEAALKKRDVKEIKALLDAGAKLDWVSEDGTSLLQQACARGHWDAVEFMLKQGANPNWRPKVAGEKFKMPLQIALDNGKKTHSALLMLLKYKADPQILFDTALYFALPVEAEAGKKNVRKEMSGIVAMCQYGYLRDNRAFQMEALATWLAAQKGALTDDILANVLKSAIEQKMSKGFMREVMQRIKTMKSPAYGPVLLATMKHKNRIELLGQLKESGIQVNNVCELEKDGVLIEETPLFYAVRTKCDEQVIRWLLANGANVKWTNVEGKSVMDLDADPKIKQLLLNVKQGKKITQEWRDDLYTTGTTTIKTNMPWEADLNGQTVKGEHADWITMQPPANDQKFAGDVDFFWRYDKDQKTLTLEPRNGCEILQLTGNLTPFDQIEVSYIAKQKFSDRTLSYTKEEGSPLKAGSIILFRTSRGNFGKFRVIRYEDEIIDKKKRRNVSLMLHWVVYHLQEEEVRQSHSKRTIW